MQNAQDKLGHPDTTAGYADLCFELAACKSTSTTNSDRFASSLY
jgi:hypothetical protein